MIYNADMMRARQAVRLAKAELRRWERRYDHYRGPDPIRYVSQIRAAEERYNQAVEALRLLRDGKERLPEGADAATAHRMPDLRI
jgi:hypothetical protein